MNICVTSTPYRDLPGSLVASRAHVCHSLLPLVIYADIHGIISNGISCHRNLWGMAWKAQSLKAVQWYPYVLPAVWEWRCPSKQVDGESNLMTFTVCVRKKVSLKEPMHPHFHTSSSILMTICVKSVYHSPETEAQWWLPSLSSSSL